jgi:hypothetical protein
MRKKKGTLGSFRPSFGQGKVKREEEFLRFHMLIMDRLCVIEGLLVSKA